MILERFKSPASYYNCWNCSDYEGQMGCVIAFDPADAALHFQYPSIRENINNEQVALAFDVDTLEVVDAYLVGYALSMLARYYPDYWIGCLDSHCKAAKVIERLVFVLIRKFPVMALKLLASDDIVISTHRPPWHT
jgi:hypothetical protein